jgi:hypothetical protein
MVSPTLHLQRSHLRRDNDSVKVLASILACLIVFHGACMARCIGEGSHSVLHSEAPPCHNSDGTPDRNDGPLPISTCLGGPAIEAKSLSNPKCLLGTAVLPVAIPVVATTVDAPLDGTPMERLYIPPPLRLSTILRI